MRGHIKDLGNFRHLKELRAEDDKSITDIKVGDKFDLSVFKVGDNLTISSVSKGKGFQGVVKRHGLKAAQAMVRSTPKENRDQ